MRIFRMTFLEEDMAKCNWDFEKTIKVIKMFIEREKKCQVRMSSMIYNKSLKKYSIVYQEI